MTDHKFTDDEIIKALRELQEMSEITPPICHYEKDITEPPFCKPFEQFQNDVKVALEVINRQKAEIESLNAIHADALESLRLAAEANKDMQAEINKLKGSRNRWKQIATDFDKASRETEKEIERLYKEIERISKMTVETNVKEMTEGNHESQST